MMRFLVGAWALCVVVVLVSSPAVSQSGGDNCLSGGEIQMAIVDGEIRPLNQILQAAGISGDVKVLEPVRVCLDGGEPYYLLNLLNSDGDARKVVLHAVTGAS